MHSAIHAAQGTHRHASHNTLRFGIAGTLPKLATGPTHLEVGEAALIQVQHCAGEALVARPLAAAQPEACTAASTASASAATTVAAPQEGRQAWRRRRPAAGPEALLRRRQSYNVCDVTCVPHWQATCARGAIGWMRA